MRVLLRRLVLEGVLGPSVMAGAYQSSRPQRRHTQKSVHPAAGTDPRIHTAQSPIRLTFGVTDSLGQIGDGFPDARNRNQASSASPIRLTVGRKFQPQVEWQPGPCLPRYVPLTPVNPSAQSFSFDSGGELCVVPVLKYPGRSVCLLALFDASNDVATKVAVEHVEQVLVLATQDVVTGLEDRVRRFSPRRRVFRHCAKVLIGQGNSPASPWSLLTSFLGVSQSQTDT